MNNLSNLIEKVKGFLRTYCKLYDIILLFINFLVMYICSGLNLFVGLISIDSIYSAIDFIKNNSNPDLTESQVLVTNYNLYKVATIERSVYYITCQILYSFVTIFIFNSDVILIRYAIGLTLLPYIFNEYIYYKLSKYFEKITYEKNELIRKFCFEQIANTVVHLEKTYLENEVIIEKTEIVGALENIENLKSEMGTFIKNVLITLLMIYLRNNSNLYYKIAKYIYKFGYNEMIQRTGIDEAQEIFRDVVRNKKYDQLTKPMFIQSVMYLYWAKEDVGSMKKLLNKFKYRMVVMLTLWTLGSFFSGYVSVIVIFLMSFIIALTRKLPMSENILVPILSNFNMDSSKVLKFVKDKIIKITELKYVDDRTIVAMVATIIAGLFGCGPFLLSFVNQFAGILLLNNITFNLIKIIHKKSNKRVKNIYHTVKYSKFTSLKYVLLVISYIIFTKISNFSAFLIPIIINFISTDSKIFRYIYLLLYVGMMNNRENYIKLLIFGYAMSLVDSIFNTNVPIVTRKDNYDEKYLETDYVHPTKKMARKKQRKAMDGTVMYNSFIVT